MNPFLDYIGPLLKVAKKYNAKPTLRDTTDYAKQEKLLISLMDETNLTKEHRQEINKLIGQAREKIMKG